MENKKEAEESEAGDNSGENSKENSSKEDENLAAEDTAKDLADLPDLEGVVVSTSVSGLENSVSGLENSVSGLENSVSGEENSVSGEEDTITKDANTEDHLLTKTNEVLAITDESKGKLNFVLLLKRSFHRY